MAWWKKDNVAGQPNLGLAAGPDGATYPDVNRIDPKLHRSGSRTSAKEVMPTRQELFSELLHACLGEKISPCDGPVQVDGHWFGYACRGDGLRPKLGLLLPCTKCSEPVQVCTISDELDRANQSTWRNACLANSWWIKCDMREGETHPSALELKSIILRKQSHEAIEKCLKSNEYFSVVVICEACKQKL